MRRHSKGKRPRKELDEVGRQSPSGESEVGTATRILGAQPAGGEPTRDPETILDDLRRSLRAGAYSVAWKAITALPGATDAHALSVGAARDVVSVAISFTDDHCASTLGNRRALSDMSIDVRLERRDSLEPLLSEFATIIATLRPSLARAHIGQAYRIHGPHLRAYCARRRLNDTPISRRAMVHEAFATLLQELDQDTSSWGFPEGERVKQLLRKRVDEQAHNRVRRHLTRKRKSETLEGGIGVTDGPSSIQPIDRDASQPPSQETALIVEEELERLTSLERSAVEMRTAGLSNTEIARELGIHRKTVAEHLKRADKKLDASDHDAKDEDSRKNRKTSRDDCQNASPHRPK